MVTFLKTYLKIIIHSQDLEKCNREVSLQTSPLFLIGFFKIITSCGDNYSCCWVLACDNRCILVSTTPKTWEVALDWCVVMSFLCISRISWSHIIKAYVRKHHPFTSGLLLSVHRNINCKRQGNICFVFKQSQDPGKYPEHERHPLNTCTQKLDRGPTSAVATTKYLMKT